jgi:hypothetical protein
MKKKLERMLKFALMQRKRALDNIRFYKNFKGDQSHKIYMLQLAETEEITWEWVINSLSNALEAELKEKKPINPS